MASSIAVRISPVLHEAAPRDGPTGTHKRQRVKAIQAKMANTRADWTHKATTAIARRAKLIVIGDVSSAKLIQNALRQIDL